MYSLNAEETETNNTVNRDRIQVLKPVIYKDQVRYLSATNGKLVKSVENLEKINDATLLKAEDYHDSVNEAIEAM